MPSIAYSSLKTKKLCIIFDSQKADLCIISDIGTTNWGVTNRYTLEFASFDVKYILAAGLKMEP